MDQRIMNNKYEKNFAIFASLKCSRYLQKLCDKHKYNYPSSSYISETQNINNIHALITENVIRLRRERGISQLDLSLSIGYNSTSVISKVESNREGKHLNVEQLYKIACVLDVPIGVFFKNLPYDL